MSLLPSSFAWAADPSCDTRAERLNGFFDQLLRHLSQNTPHQPPQLFMYPGTALLYQHSPTSSCSGSPSTMLVMPGETEASVTRLATTGAVAATLNTLHIDLRGELTHLSDRRFVSYASAVPRSPFFPLRSASFTDSTTHHTERQGPQVT